MTKLSVNINKIATLRNARGGNMPNLLHYAKLIQNFGADGITVHPRPDERHITYNDVYELKPLISKEFNIEGNPKEEKFVKLVLDIKPTQVTLVPDTNNQITSNCGWDTIKEEKFLNDIINEFKKNGIRTSIFIDSDLRFIEGAKNCTTDRIELYTESYADNYKKDKIKAISSFIKSAELANKLNLGINAGHDLNLDNLRYFYKSIPNLKEVSIGHALVSDALYYGMENTVQLYKRLLNS
jgi:pyridoxine 5-phosphate synthase